VAEAAYRLARALLMAALPTKRAEAVGADLALLARLVRFEPAVRDFVGNPRIPAVDKERVLATAVREDLVRRLLAALVENRDTGLLPRVSAEYERLRRRRAGAVLVEIETAAPLTPTQAQRISSAIADRTGRSASATATVRPGLLGGIRVRFDGKVADGSLHARLNTIKERLLAQ
jgi:F-type H+-transporting ATPase subunit delta